MKTDWSPISEEIGAAFSLLRELGRGLCSVLLPFSRVFFVLYVLFGNCLLSLFQSRGWSFVGKNRLLDGGWSWASKQIEGERRGRGEGEGEGREGGGEQEGEREEGALITCCFPSILPAAFQAVVLPPPHFADGEAEAGHSLPPPAPQGFLSSQALSPRAAHSPNRSRPTSQRADRRAGDALSPTPTPHTPAPPPPSSPHLWRSRAPKGHGLCVWVSLEEQHPHPILFMGWCPSGTGGS